MQISGIKTIPEAKAAVQAVEEIPLVALPAELKDGASQQDQEIYKSKLAEAQRRNAWVTDKNKLIASVKSFVLGRLDEVPTEITKIGLEVRAEVGPIEMVSIRIVQHK